MAVLSCDTSWTYVLTRTFCTHRISCRQYVDLRDALFFHEGVRSRYGNVSACQASRDLDVVCFSHLACHKVDAEGWRQELHSKLFWILGLSFIFLEIMTRTLHFLTAYCQILSYEVSLILDLSRDLADR